MRARQTLKLPRARDLKSARLEDVQNMFRLIIEELDKQWRLLHQDVSTIQVDDDGWIYFGGKDQTNSVRIGRDGIDWVVQHFIAGTYTERFKTSP